MQNELKILQSLPMAFAVFHWGKQGKDVRLLKANSLFEQFESMSQNENLSSWHYLANQVSLHSETWNELILRLIKNEVSFEGWLKPRGSIKGSTIKIFPSGNDNISVLIENRKSESPTLMADRLQGFFEPFRISLFVIDLAMEKCYLTPCCLKELGYEYKSLFCSTKEFLEMVHSLDRKRIQNLLNEINETEVEEERKQELLRLLKKNGELMWVDCLFEVQEIPSEGKKVILAYLRDVTQIQQTKESLHASEENFHSFFDSINDMVFIGGPSGQILLANQSVTNSLGYSLEDLRGKSLQDFYPHANKAKADKMLLNLFSGTVEHCDFPLTTSTGEILPTELSIWFGIWEKKDCIFIMARDTTVQQETQQRFDVLFQSNFALMFHASYPDWKLLHVNGAFIHSLGYQRNEVLDHSLIELKLLNSREQSEEIIEQVKTHKNILNKEIEIKRKNGTTFHGLLSGEILQSAGQDTFLGFAVDISERKKAELALMRERDLFSEGPVLILQIDGIEDFHISFISGNVLTILGYAAGQMIQESFSFLQLLHPDDKDRFLSNVRDHHRKGADSFDFFFRLQSRIGNYKWFYSLFRIEKQGSSSTVALHGYIFDQTELKDTQNTLSKERMRLRDTLEETARMNRLMMGREVRIVEMKKKVNTLLERLGEEPRYKSVIDQDLL